ncbi:1-phosphofructokinase [Alkalicoccus urumqiensis]|uniref:1-phosphofructokinase n=1 Tax=Alkalicoccus urumqiensis TaxID=1548213 RepID=UPI0015E615DB|nr:1-phosphofructokinase [Alkalicoccus urumqiensis]
MIYTVTLNPSIDYFLEVEHFTEGKTNRASSQRLLPGGKGINVSKVLHAFGHRTELFGFTAGFTGAYLEDTLQGEGLHTNFLHVEGMTRINVKLKTETETEINGQAPAITEADVKKLEQQIDELTKDDTLVLSGSLPSTVQDDTYYRLAAEARSRGIRTVIDTSGTPLKKALDAEPFLIKPNIAELEALYGEKAAGKNDVLELASRAVAGGAHYVLVSRGADPALLVSRDGFTEAAVPKGEVRNSVGAGDSMVAGFLYRLEENGSIEDAFRTSVAFGSATTFSTGFATRSLVEKLEAEIDLLKGELT